jgi:hypothetical protein
MPVLHGNNGLSADALHLAAAQAYIALFLAVVARAGCGDLKFEARATCVDDEYVYGPSPLLHLCQSIRLTSSGTAIG